MNILNIKEKNLSIIIPFKNGHTLLRTTFIHLFKHLNIDVELEHDQMKLLKKSYIFVRNPIDRFFSSYSWMENMLKNGDDLNKEYIIDCMKSANVNNISDYINNYENFIDKCDDTHFIPQSSHILDDDDKMLKNEIINNQFDLKLFYQNRFGVNYKIFKIEEIDKIIKKNTLNLISKNIGFENKTDSVGFDNNKFEFLIDFPNDVSFLFTTFYLYFKNLFEMSLHHKHINYMEEITLQEYYKVCNITNNECDFFGYDEKVINNKVFKIVYENKIIENKVVENIVIENKIFKKSLI